MCTIARRCLLLSAAVWLLACTEDPKATQLDGGPSDLGPTEGCPLTPPTSCPTPESHYSDIEPILKERCFSCHDGTGEQWGLTSYEHVADWFNEIRAQMIACTMPPLDSGVIMPPSERMQIVQWIRCGYPM